MNNIREWLKGKKTYLLTAFGAVVIIVNHFFGPIPGIGLDPNAWISELTGVATAATLRAGIAKASN